MTFYITGNQATWGFNNQHLELHLDVNRYQEHTTEYLPHWGEESLHPVLAEAFTYFSWVACKDGVLQSSGLEDIKSGSLSRSASERYGWSPYTNDILKRDPLCHKLIPEVSLWPQGGKLNWQRLNIPSISSFTHIHQVSVMEEEWNVQWRAVPSIWAKFCKTINKTCDQKLSYGIKDCWIGLTMSAITFCLCLLLCGYQQHCITSVPFQTCTVNQGKSVEGT